MKIDIFTKAMGCTKLTYQNFSFLQVIHPKKKVSAEKKRIKKYVGNYIYENNNLKHFSHPEGYVEPDGNSYRYVYSYLDHLGNVRLNYSDLDDNGSISTSEILQENNYYPMGLKHKGYNTNIISEHKFKFQSQERQDELNLNWDSFKYRNYDYAIGRFMSIDPLAEKFPYMSTYQFAGNKPIWSREIEGLESARDAIIAGKYYNSLTPEQQRAHTKREGLMLVGYASLFIPGPEDVILAGFVATKIGGVATRLVSKFGDDAFKAVKNIFTKGGDDAVDVTKDVMKNRVKLRKGTKEAVQDAASKTKDGKFIDPNTRKPIEKGQEVYGHKTGQEWSKYKKDPANQGKTRKEVIKDQNDPNKYQIEDRKSNASHKYEEK